MIRQINSATVTQALQTKADHISTTSRHLKNLKRTQQSHFNWEYDKEFHPECKLAFDSTRKIALEIIPKQNKRRWLSLLGNSGVGKTHLAKKLSALLKTYGYNGCFYSWSRIIDYARKGDFGIFEHLENVPIAVIDDIGAGYENYFSSSKITELADKRLNKWTIFTSNLQLRQIAETIDTRLASRMIRGENKVIEFNECPDYCLKNYYSKK